jgi:hypothetical protein
MVRKLLFLSSNVVGDATIEAAELAHRKVIIMTMSTPN